jgi:hypothetical protein
MISRTNIALVAPVIVACLCGRPSAVRAADAAANQNPPARPKKMQLLIRPRTPQLMGPDEIEPSPVLVLMKQRAELDGRPVTPDEFEKLLVTLANNYRLLHPDGTFNGKFIVACEPEVDTPRVAEYLGRAHKAGFPHASFLFVILAGDGANPARDKVTAANGEIAGPGTAARPRTATLQLGKYADCLSLSKDLVAHRHQNDAVLLDAGRRPLEARKK